MHANSPARECYDFVERFAHQADNAFRRAAAAGLLLALLASPALAQVDPTPGSLHTAPFPGFASGNGKITNLAMGTGFDSALNVAIQTDGKILLAGICALGAGDYKVCLARFLADGSLDTSFVGPSSNGNGKFILSAYEALLVGGFRTPIALQKDGKILVGFGGRCLPPLGYYELCVMRFNTDGSFDTSFVGPSGTGNGVAEITYTNPSSGYGLTSLLIQPDGKIVVGGFCTNGTNLDFCFARLLSNGTYDTSFNAYSNPGSGRFVLPRAGSFREEVRAMALQPDGKILFAGICGDGETCVGRLLPSGNPDSSFAGPAGTSNGVVQTKLGAAGYDDDVYSLILQPDGRIVAAASCITGPSDDACLLRLNANGSFDTTFDGASGSGNGKVFLNVGAAGNAVDETITLLAQPDGKLIVADTCAENGLRQFCVARLQHDGTLDASFDGASGVGNGRVVIPMKLSPDANYVQAAALQPNGMIVLVGRCGDASSADFCVARVHGGPNTAKQCSMDIDGDGATTATIDGLVATRVMLGLTGNGVIGGIAFPPTATRTNWTQIRDFLAWQCGMQIAP